MRNSQNRYFYHIFVSLGDAPVAITLNVVWMEREFDAYKCLAACIHLSSTVSQLLEPQVQKAPFSRTAAHIFVSRGDAPATTTQCVVWMERQFNACQTPCSMYLSIFKQLRHCAIADGFGESVQSWCYAAALLGTRG